MKYEGKLYGKVAGKYIEVTDHISNDKLAEKISDLIANCNERANDFTLKGMDVSAGSSLAMPLLIKLV